MIRIILVLFAVSTVSLHQQKKCPKYCESCDSLFGCRSCLKSKLIKGKCVPTKDLANCLVYFKDNSCKACAPGYALASNSDLNNRSLHQQKKAVCTPINIKDCQVDFQLEKTGLSHESQNEQICVACAGGYPEVGNKKCRSFKQEDFGEEQRVNNCLWGGRIYKLNTKYCLRCKDGYASSIMTGKCVKTSYVWCLEVTEDKKCFTCDIFEG